MFCGGPSHLIKTHKVYPLASGEGFALVEPDYSASSQTELHVSLFRPSDVSIRFVYNLNFINSFYLQWLPLLGGLFWFLSLFFAFLKAEWIK